MRLNAGMAARVLVCLGLLTGAFMSPALAAKRGNAADFAGVWDTIVPEVNALYTLTLKVEGTTVTGTFINKQDGQYNGTLTGTVDPSLDGTASGGRLDYVYLQPKTKNKGSGYFIVGDDGTIAGFTQTEGSSRKYGWEGKRVPPHESAKRGNADDFEGVWDTVLEGLGSTKVKLTLRRVDRINIVGELSNTDKRYDGKLTGIVDPSLDGTASGGRLEFHLLITEGKFDGDGYLIVGDNDTIQGFATFAATGSRKHRWEGKRISKTAPKPKQGQVKFTKQITGYDEPGGDEKCFLFPGDRAKLLGVEPNDPQWKHLKGSKVCDGKDFWVYDAGELEEL